MGSEHKEIELKLQVALKDIAVIRNHPQFSSVLRDGVHETLKSVYFDSDNRYLRNHGFALRVRHIDDKRIQTIKSTQRGIDWIERSEWEQPIEGDQPDLRYVTDVTLRPVLTNGIRGALKPLFETRIERTVCHLNGNNINIVMAIDEGQIVADDLSSQISEIELELKQGDARDLFKVARAIGDIVPAQLDVKSKYERGFDLIEKRPVAVEKARSPQLGAGMGAGRAFSLIGWACLRQLIVNTAATIDRDVEALHQMRVALRRLRAAISIFGDFLADDKVEMIKTELRWLAGEFGPARNVDTLIVEVLRPLRKQHPKDPGLISLGKMFARQRLKCYRRAQEAVQSARFRKLVLDTAEWVEAGPWSRTNDPLKQARFQAPIEGYAAGQLSQRFKKIRRRGAKMGRLSAEQLHRLRIQIKKARYAAEFFRSIYRGNKATKRYKKALSSLVQMQDSFGRINDIVTHKALFAEIIANPRRGLTAEQNHRRAYAAGLIIGDQHARLHGFLNSAREAYSRFEGVKAFWPKPHLRDDIVQLQSLPIDRDSGPAATLVESMLAGGKDMAPQAEPVPDKDGQGGTGDQDAVTVNSK